MHVDWWTLALQTVNVLILVWLLQRFLYRPVMRAIAARQEAADKLIAGATAEKEAAAAEVAALKAKSDAFAASAALREQQMRAEVEGERARLLAQANAEAAAAVERADAAAAAGRARMAAELQARAGVLAGRMAETLLRRLPAPTATEAMFQALLDRLRQLDDDERRRLARDAPLRAITALPLDDAQRARFGAALAAALSLSAPPEFACEPDLIAGFELRGSHMLVRNSWRADLDELLAAMKVDDHDNRH